WPPGDDIETRHLAILAVNKPEDFRLVATRRFVLRLALAVPRARKPPLAQRQLQLVLEWKSPGHALTEAFRQPSLGQFLGFVLANPDTIQTQRFLPDLFFIGFGCLEALDHFPGHVQDQSTLGQLGCSVPLLLTFGAAGR